MAKRHIMRIETSAPQSAKLQALCDRYGMTHLAISSQLIEWFSDQEATIQREIMQRLPGRGNNHAELARKIFKRMSGKK